MSFPAPTSRLKIAIFMPNLEGGGAERVMVTLANGFAARGHEVSLVLAARRGPFLDEVAPDVRIVDLRSRRILMSILPLRAYLKQDSPDVLLSALSHANVVALIGRRLAGWRGRSIVSERTSFVSATHYARTFKDRVLRRLMRATYSGADAITVVAEPVVGELASGLRLPPEQIHYVPNPMVSRRLALLADAEPDHPWLVSGETPVILGVGRLSHEKGFDILIEAFARIAGQCDARLIVLGEGPMRPQLERQIARAGLGDRVSLPGFAKNPFAAMKRASLFVLPSRFEGMPGALIQAMACGTPVVSSDCHSGPRHVLEDGKWGPLVPVGDSAALARAMTETLASPRHPPVAQRAQIFDEDRAVDHYLELMGASPRGGDYCSQ